MQPVDFPGAREIGKPKDMTDEQCTPIMADSGTDADGFHYWLTAWRPSHEDMQALWRGEPIYVKTLSAGLPPMSLFTMAENGKPNFE